MSKHKVDDSNSLFEEFFKGELNHYDVKIKKMNEYFRLNYKKDKLQDDFYKLLDEETEAHHEVLERLGDD